jgi:peptidoglycan/xylan/chitin deacetylase (PgdA/CDA1 family)
VWRSGGGESAEQASGALMAVALAVVALVTVALATCAARSASALPVPDPSRASWRGGVTRAAEAATSVAASATPVAPPRLSGAHLLSGHEPQGRGYVAFTFDDGPHAVTTPLILAALARFDVPGAFFVCGYQIDGDSASKRANATALDAIVAAGHLIGNHTYRHTRLEGASQAFAWDAIAHNERVIAPHLGRSMRLFRPPYGRLSPVAARLLDDLGYTIVRWSVDPDDYRPRTPTEVRDRVLHDLRERGGGIVLLHDTKLWSAKALPLILADLERENCARLSRGEQPMLPVSLDYFARAEDGSALPIAPEVEAQTARTRATLERHCEALHPATRAPTAPVSRPD